MLWVFCADVAFTVLVLPDFAVAFVVLDCANNPIAKSAKPKVNATFFMTLKVKV